MLENAQAAPDAEIVATRIVGVVALVDVMVDAMEIVKQHVLNTVRRMAAQGCAVDVQAAATVILDALGTVRRAAATVIRDALGAVIRDAQAAPGAQAHALDVRHAAGAPDALPGAVGVVTTAAPDRVSYHAAETAHQRVLTPVLERVRR